MVFIGDLALIEYNFNRTEDANQAEEAWKENGNREMKTFMIPF